MPLNYASDSGAASICQWSQSVGAKRPGGGNLPSPAGKMFVNTCMKMTFSCTFNAIITRVGYVKWYTNPLIPPFNLFSSNQRGKERCVKCPLPRLINGEGELCEVVNQSSQTPLISYTPINVYFHFSVTYVYHK